MPTVTARIPASGHTLASSLREILDENGRAATRIELKPRSPFAGDPEFDAAKDFLASPAPWSVTNGANADAINAHTTKRSWLTCDLSAANTTWSGATRSGPFVWQVLSGDRDLYARIALRSLQNFHFLGINCQSTSNDDDWVQIRVYVDQAISGVATASFLDTNNGTSSFPPNVAITTSSIGDYLYVRLARAGNVFAGYVSVDGRTWTTIGTSATRTDFSADGRWGLAAGTVNTANTGIVSADFLRQWPPYDATSPVSSVVIDCGVAGAVWDMSSVIALLNPYMEDGGVRATAGAGTFKFKYGAGDTSPPALNGTYLTLAQLQSESDPGGRYFKLEVQYTSPNGYEQAAFCGLELSVTFNASVICIDD